MGNSVIINNISEYQKLRERQILLLLEINVAHYSYKIIRYQKLSSRINDMLIQKGFNTEYVMAYQKLSHEQINKIIDIGGAFLDVLYRYQKLSSENIDKAINRKQWLSHLLKYQKTRINEEQIERIRVIQEADYNI